MNAIIIQQGSSGVLTKAQQQLIVHIEHELVAPCCYSQIVANHLSYEAEQMREEIVQMVASGRTEPQILEAYKARYGEIILAVPDGLTGKIAFTVPPVAGLLACFFVVLLIHRWRHHGLPAPQRVAAMPAALPADQKMLERIRAEASEW